MGIQLLKSITGRTLIESHRGIIGEAPENSWTAIQLGHQLGADLIEVDVQLSGDGVPFIRHHYRLPDGRWCNQLPWAVLKDVTIDHEPLPRLDDLLVWARENDVCLSLDLKSAFSTENSLAQAVIQTLESTGSKEHVVLLFLDHNELMQVKRSYPEITVRALSRVRMFNYAAYLRSIGADCANIAYDLFRPVDVEQMHAAGISVALDSLWNSNADVFGQVEIDIFTHDHPAKAKELLGLYVL